MSSPFPEVDFSAREFTPEEIRSAQLAVCEVAEGKAEAVELRSMLGLLDEPEPAPVAQRRPRAVQRRPILRWAAWMDRAACAGDDPDLWNPDAKGQDVTDARLTCLQCPVRVECGEHAANNREAHGVWGGALLEKRTERDALLRRHGVKIRERPAPGPARCACGAPALVGKRVCGVHREGFTSAVPVADHLVKLRESGWLVVEIIAATGLPKNTVKSAVNRRYPSMRVEVAQAILALEPRSMVPA